MVVTWIALPVAIAGRIGPIAAIGRSNRSIRGYRWHVLGLVILFFVFVALVERVVGGISQYFGISALMPSSRSFASYILHTTILLLINQAVFGMLSGLAAAFSFLHLRRIKEGKFGAELADIFQ